MIKELFNIDWLEQDDESLSYLAEGDPSEENVKNNIEEFNSKKLCQIIVCNRYLNTSKDLAIACMEQLSKRRAEGDDFDFESYIETSLSELPVLNFKISDIRDAMSKIIRKPV
jgi:hypothetical protein